MSKNHEFIQQARIRFGHSVSRTASAVGAAADSKSSTITEILSEAPLEIREESLKLVQRLFLTSEQAPPKAVMFAAIDSGNGCSRMCATTAQLLAENVSGSVCLVEGNFRTPSLPGLFGVGNHHGLADSLREEGAIRGFAKQASRDNVWLLSSGSLGRDSSNLLNCDRMKERIAELRSAFDYVLIDAPPLNSYADAMVFGRLADGIVLVLEANATRREAALRVMERLQATRIPVLGAVLNKRTFPIPSAIYKRL
jgi:capsular exopolysaccharide synthesis family protein